MLVVTNYPQVPLTTSNVATDAARVDNQQRPPVIPPQAPTKGHQERAFTPQHERTATETQTPAADGAQDKVQEKRQGSGQEQQSRDRQPQQPQPKQHQSKLLQSFIAGPAALQRKDIRLKVTQDPDQAARQAPPKTSQPPGLSQPRTQPQQSKQFYQEFGRRIDNFYRRQSQPQQETELSAWI
ncbi:hypothetical protein [Shewanella salipaludis]|uniref:Uncharacterized protein n=1 Tax=Shewanella salipaludis TaxID=2723052 RepID=A0A972JME2_9GAMM|nr:hypothetical protein [Shewanella salipaludis]NMH65016.1 hypothetical protein [Shewanella salipaludis]